VRARARECRCLSELPFGEEVAAGVGGRTTSQGYSQVDNVRQQFTGYERDGETGLDYAQARYFSSTQGRFISPDPLLASGQPAEPQSWNRYAYVLNNPLMFVDPFGLIWGRRDYEDENGNKRTEIRWFDGDTVGDGYTTFTDGHYTFGDGRAYWFADNGDFGLVDTVYAGTEQSGDSCLHCAGLIDGIAMRGPAMQNAILGVAALNLAPAVVASVGLAGGGATTLGLETSGGASALTNSQLANVSRISRIIQDHLTKLDVQGLMRDVSNNPVPKPGGGHFQHYKEVTDAVNGLRGAVRSLEGSLRNPNLSPAARVQIERSVETAKNYMTRVEKIIRSH